jgi:hypothetical protein
MKDKANAGHSAPERGGIAQIALHDFDRQAIEIGACAGRANERADPMTGLQELPHDGRADKTAPTGDEDHAPPFLKHVPLKSTHHCERTEAIQDSNYISKIWIASSLALLAMTIVIQFDQKPH